MSLRRLLTIVGLLVMLAKVAFVISLGPAAIEMDAYGYWQLSTRVIQGDVLMLGDPIAYRTPAYPWFLAALRSLFGQRALLAIVVIQAGMWTTAIWIAGQMAARISGSMWALPLTLWVSIPAVSALTYTATLLTESLFTLLLMAGCMGVLRYSRQPNPRAAGVAGLILALTILTRPIAMHLWIVHVVFLVCALRRFGGSIRWRDVVLAGLTCCLVMSPWLWRNQRLFGEPFVTEFLGRNLWIVTFQDGSGAGLELPVTERAEKLKQELERAGVSAQWRETWTVSRALVAAGASDPEADRWMREVAIQAIWKHPQTFAYKAVRRMANYWRCAVTELPVQGAADAQYMDQPTWSHSIPWVRWTIDHRLSRSVWLNTVVTTMVAIATMILVVNPHTRCSGVWLGMILLYFSVVTGLLEIPNYRYRVVLEPLSSAVVAAAVVLIVMRSVPVGRRNLGETGRLETGRPETHRR